MNINGNGFVPQYNKNQIKIVNKKLAPEKNRACNNNLLFSAGTNTYSGNFYGHSLKRSNLKNCSFDNAIFDHTSFSGSTLDNVSFHANCKFESVYLEQCVMTDVLFEPGLHLENCNFSNSQLKNLKFSSSEIRSIYFDNCYLDNCTFNECEIRATMFDGAFLSNCSIINCNMRNLNIEFVTLDNCDLSGTIISYFQLPYIIGIFKETNNIIDSFAGIHSTKVLSIKEYIENIEDAIIYFTGLEEYFPLVNLYYVKKEYDIAYNCIQHGIKKSLINNDIRMIENYCKLGQSYDLLTIGDIQNILKEVDKAIEKRRQHPMYGLLLAKSYHLKAALSQNNNKAKLEIIIDTNIDGSRFDIVSKFCDDIDNIIASIFPNKINTEYRLSHNSPFEICLTCIGLTADLIAISGPIYHFISRKLKKNTKLSPELQAYIKSSNTMYIESLNNQFDFFEQSLQGKKKSEYGEIIREFRGKIITTATEQLNKDFALLVSQYSE